MTAPKTPATFETDPRSAVQCDAWFGFCVFLKLCIDAGEGRGYLRGVMKNNTTAAVIAPFTTKPSVTLTAPTSAKEMNEALNLGINLNSGAISLKKRDALMSAALKLVGGRKSNESAESWAARAQEALNARFA